MQQYRVIGKHLMVKKGDLWVLKKRYASKKNAARAAERLMEKESGEAT